MVLFYETKNHLLISPESSLFKYIGFSSRVFTLFNTFSFYTTDITIKGLDLLIGLFITSDYREKHSLLSMLFFS